MVVSYTKNINQLDKISSYGGQFRYLETINQLTISSNRLHHVPCVSKLQKLRGLHVSSVVQSSKTRTVHLPAVRAHVDQRVHSLRRAVRAVKNGPVTAVRSG